MDVKYGAVLGLEVSCFWSRVLSFVRRAAAVTNHTATEVLAEGPNREPFSFHIIPKDPLF